jgi:hypothetical protein
MRPVSLRRTGSGAGLLQWTAGKQTSTYGRADETGPLQRPCNRFRQLSRQNNVYHAHIARHAQPAHRWFALKSQSDCTRYARLCGAAAVAQLRTRHPSSAHTEKRLNAIMGSCKRRPLWAVIAIGSHDTHGTAQMCHRRPARRNPPSCTNASRMHSTTSMQLAGCAVGTDRPAEAARSSSRVWTGRTFTARIRRI